MPAQRSRPRDPPHIVRRLIFITVKLIYDATPALLAGTELAHKVAINSRDTVASPHWTVAPPRRLEEARHQHTFSVRYCAIVG